jgi:hypothetical protein
MLIILKRDCFGSCIFEVKKLNHQQNIRNVAIWTKNAMVVACLLLVGIEAQAADPASNVF